MLIGLMNKTSNDSWSRGGEVLERGSHFKLFRLPWCSLSSVVYQLALVETSEASVLARTCSDFRKEIQTEIGQLLPATFRFVVRGSLLSLVKESINVLRKCAVQVGEPVVENHSHGYPENIQLFRYYTLSLVRSTFDIRMAATVG